MRPREIVVRAERIDSRRGRARRSPEGRTCAVCETILSIYNHKNRCSVHEPYTRRKYRSVARQGAA